MKDVTRLPKVRRSLLDTAKHFLPWIAVGISAGYIMAMHFRAYSIKGTSKDSAPPGLKQQLQQSPSLPKPETLHRDNSGQRQILFNLVLAVQTRRSGYFGEYRIDEDEINDQQLSCLFSQIPAGSKSDLNSLLERGAAIIHRSSVNRIEVSNSVRGKSGRRFICEYEPITLIIESDLLEEINENISERYFTRKNEYIRQVEDIANQRRQQQKKQQAEQAQREQVLQQRRLAESQAAERSRQQKLKESEEMEQRLLELQRRIESNSLQE